MGNESQALSMSSFKRPDGRSFKTADEMSKEEKYAFALAKLMKTTIEKLEMSIPNDRIFNRTKYEIMSAFHDCHEEIKAGTHE